MIIKSNVFIINVRICWWHGGRGKFQLEWQASYKSFMSLTMLNVHNITDVTTNHSIITSS